MILLDRHLRGVEGTAGVQSLRIQIEKTGECLNFQLRRTSRLVSRHYDDALRPLGLRSNQFTILAVLAQRGPISLTKLADLLEMERSALARNLKPIARKGFVVVSQGTDRRIRSAQLAPAGKRKLGKAWPTWHRAQRELVANVGQNQAALLMRALSKVRATLKQKSDI